jgi:hypothetical protein
MHITRLTKDGWETLNNIASYLNLLGAAAIAIEMDGESGHSRRLRGAQMGIVVKAGNSDYMFSPWLHIGATLYVHAGEVTGNGFTIVS